MEKRVAVVTGGTRGMGQSISIELAKSGNIVLALYRSDEKSAEITKNEMRKYTTESDVMQMDVGSTASVNETVSRIGDTFGRIDILINNAGILDFSFIEEMTEESLDHVMNVNFKGQFRMIKACLPYMKKHHYGRIVNASSISSTFADVGQVSYGASKASVDMLTRIAAGELAPYGITVNGYAPGIIHTDMTDAMIQERGEIQVKQIPMNRFGRGEDVASAVAFFASPEAGYVTGQTIGVDGGFFIVQNPYRATEFAERSGGLTV